MKHRFKEFYDGQYIGPEMMLTGFTNAGFWHGVRYWLIELLAGKAAIIVNCTIEVVWGDTVVSAPDGLFSSNMHLKHPPGYGFTISGCLPADGEGK